MAIVSVSSVFSTPIPPDVNAPKMLCSNGHHWRWRDIEYEFHTDLYRDSRKMTTLEPFFLPSTFFSPIRKSLRDENPDSWKGVIDDNHQSNVDHPLKTHIFLFIFVTRMILHHSCSCSNSRSCIFWWLVETRSSSYRKHVQSSLRRPFENNEDLIALTCLSKPHWWRVERKDDSPMWDKSKGPHAHSQWEREDLVDSERFDCI